MASSKKKISLSYEKGTADTQKSMKEFAKILGVKVRFIYSMYVGHAGIEIEGGKRAIKKFLEQVGLGWGTDLINQEV